MKKSTLFLIISGMIFLVAGIICSAFAGKILLQEGIENIRWSENCFIYLKTDGEEIRIGDDSYRNSDDDSDQEGIYITLPFLRVAIDDNGVEIEFPGSQNHSAETSLP